MYKIGEFSKITNLTVKTLRYYDSENILKPSYRNKINDYRYYDQDDFEKAKLISLLRNLDFSIMEMKDLLQNYESSSDLSYFLKEKRDMIELKIRKERSLIERIDRFVKLNPMEVKNMDYKIEVKSIEPMLVASIRYKGRYDDIGIYYEKLYKVLKENANGDPINCYYDDEYKENADIEVCVPIEKYAEYNGIEVKTLPRIKAVCTTHIGAYENLNLAYKALIDYVKINNLECLTPSMEIYKRGPGMIFKGNPNKYETEIIIPIK